MKLIIHDSIDSAVRAYDPLNGGDAIRSQFIFAGCWGFLNENQDIEIVYNDICTKRNLIELFAHEVTHKYEQKLIDKYGEELATYNAGLCLQAFDLVCKIWRE